MNEQAFTNSGDRADLTSNIIRVRRLLLTLWDFLNHTCNIRITRVPCTVLCCCSLVTEMCWGSPQTMILIFKSTTTSYTWGSKLLCVMNNETKLDWTCVAKTLQGREAYLVRCVPFHVDESQNGHCLLCFAQSKWVVACLEFNILLMEEETVPILQPYSAVSLATHILH